MWTELVVDMVENSGRWGLDARSTIRADDVVRVEFGLSILVTSSQDCVVSFRDQNFRKISLS
jgi:hypothetical protein